MEPEQLARLSFMVIEDQKFQREALVLLLNSIGAQHVLEAEHGQSALEQLKKLHTTIDIILCDVDMPTMDGMATMRHLSNMDYPASIILVSAVGHALLTSIEAMTRAYGLKLLGVMPKPPSRGILQSLLNNHTSSINKPRGVVIRGVPVTLQDIDSALKKGEFIPYFQPKVSMKSGKVVGFEALIRWNNPARGLLMPGAFLKIAEEGGLMDRLTWVMLEKSAAICKKWRDQGLKLSVSVNLSLSSLSRIELTERIIEVITRQGLQPDGMIMEVTESAAMTDIGHCIENLARLRLHGFGLSIDDYGTGYSSMQQLTRVPFTELKIDQSFVMGASQHESARLVVESSLDIARKMGLQSTVEGIETAEQWVMLRNMGCDIAQGYWIARPMPESAIIGWVERWNRTSNQLPDAPLQSALKVLLVEDEDFQRDTYADMVTQLGFGWVRTAENVAEALLRLAESDYDLIITDVQLGGPTGLDLAELIRTRQTPASPATRIIVMTAHDQDQDMMLGSIALDINGLTTKPVPPRVMREVILNAMKEEFIPRDCSTYTESTREEPVAPVSTTLIRVDEFAETANNPVDCLRIPLDKLLPGMTLDETVYSKDKILVLSSGFKLTDSVINRLQDIRKVLACSDIQVVCPESSEVD